MKNIILTICAIGLVLRVSAQEPAKQGEVTYLETVKIEIRVEGMSEEMMNRIPKERKMKKILYFNEAESSYQNSKENADAPVPGGDGMRGGGMRFMMGGGSPDEMVYLNFNDKIKIEQKDFMTRIFLITEDLAIENWKFTGNQKTILDYPCMEAYQINEKDTILAWFAPSIPVPAGPGNYVNLPGLVLGVDINNGKRVIMAENIDLKPIDKELISKPKKGKKTTREEFKKIVEEKTKEMGGNSGGGTFRVVVQR